MVREERLSILIADADAKWAKRVGYQLDSMGYRVDLAGSLSEAREALQASGADFVILGLGDPSWVHTTKLRELMTEAPQAEFIALTGEGRESSEQVLRHLGLSDILPRGMPIGQLAGLVHHYGETKRLKNELSRYRQLLECRTCFETLIGGSGAMRALYRLIEQVARADAPVLINGEEGSFEEVARSIHQRSERTIYPLVIVDCAKEKADSIENKIFGPVARSGPYPGGPSPTGSAFAKAGKGTLVVGHIDLSPPAVQLRLLDFLHTPFYQGETSSEPKPIARLLATTTADMEEIVGQGRFNRELFYRMNVLKVRVPPLRERREDIPLLAEHVLQSLGEQGENRGKQPISFGDGALLHLFQHTWPGNIAELTMAIQIAAARTKTMQIEPHDLPEDMIRSDDAAQAKPAAPSTSEPLREAKRNFEADYFRSLLNRTRGNMTMASRISKVGRPYLYKKLKEYNIDPETFR